MNNLAFSYWKQGRWKDAEKLQLHVMETRKRVLGPEDPVTLSTMASLGFAYWVQGQYKEGEELQIYVLEKRNYLLGLDTLIPLRL